MILRIVHTHYSFVTNFHPAGNHLSENFKIKKETSWAWWHKSVISALGR
jgi:hypothetical protein